LNLVIKKKYDYIFIEKLDNEFKINERDFSLVKDYVIKEILNKNPNIYKKIIILLIFDIIKLNRNKTIINFENVELGKSNYKEYNKIITLILDIIKNIPNIGDNYIFQDYISRDYDEIFNFLGCIIERNDTQKSAIITRIKPENELEDWYFNNYTSKIKK